jgi:hypothetical protein
MWTNLSIGLPKVRRIMSVEKSMTTIFCNPNSFAIVDALPELVAFTAAHFIDHVIGPLH